MKDNQVFLAFVAGVLSAAGLMYLFFRNEQARLQQQQ